MYPSHDKDVYGWAVHTAQLLRDKKMSEVDFDGIVEEIEGMARSDNTNSSTACLWSFLIFSNGNTSPI